MIDTVLLLAAVIISGLVMIVSDWKWRLACLSMVQLIAFLLIAQIWPIALAAVKLLSGWIGIAILGSSLLVIDEQSGTEQNSSFRLFKFALTSLTWMVIIVLVQRLNIWLPISYTHLFSGLVFFLCGILFVSIHHSIIEAITGLLIFLAGFDIIYSSLEGSALVTGIYAVVVLLISLLGRYFSGGLVFGSDR